MDSVFFPLGACRDVKEKGERIDVIFAFYVARRVCEDIGFINKPVIFNGGIISGINRISRKNKKERDVLARFEE